LARLIFLTYNNLEKWLQPRPVPAATSYGVPYQDDNRIYQELRGREPIVFDANDIETEVMDTDNVVEVGAGPPKTDENQYGRSSLPPHNDPDDSVGDENRVMSAVSTSATVNLETVAPTEEIVNKTQIVNSKIISASVLQKETNADGTETKKKGHIPLSEPVLYTLEHKTVCLYFNTMIY